MIEKINNAAVGATGLTVVPWALGGSIQTVFHLVSPEEYSAGFTMPWEDFSEFGEEWLVGLVAIMLISSA